MLLVLLYPMKENNGNHNTNYIEVMARWILLLGGQEKILSGEMGRINENLVIRSRGKIIHYVGEPRHE